MVVTVSMLVFDQSVKAIKATGVLIGSAIKKYYPQSGTVPVLEMGEATSSEAQMWKK